MNNDERKPVKAGSIEEFIQDCPKNQTILDNLIRAWAIVNNPRYEKIMCCVSGGADSDIVLDIVWRCDKDNKVNYIWFDTGLEYQATKDHLLFLESKYGIKFDIRKPRKPIPVACKKYGVPFMSKNVSEFIQRFQSHGFKWEDESYEVLYERYPKNKAALGWWCETNGENSIFRVSRNRYLKEFMIQYPPSFKISNKCCYHVKKALIRKLVVNEGYDLNISGIRKYEGGIRGQAYKNCLDEVEGGCDSYRPVFWYLDGDKEEYEKAYGVTHSRCYTEYGLRRTGCAGCPFGRHFEEELDVLEKYEPKLYRAVSNIFKDSYEYTRKYQEFVNAQNQKEEREQRDDILD